MSIPELPPQVDVCVVGAGPAGLACALSLSQRGIKPLVLDKLSGTHNSSRAAAVHAHTLEELDTLGCAEELVSLGTKAATVTFKNQKEQPVMPVRFSALEGVTKFPFMLMIPQHTVESVLRRRLEKEGIHIHGGKAVTGMREVQDGSCELEIETGQKVTAKYVVAADGAKSIIRTLSNTPFRDPGTGALAGDKSSRTVFLADLELEEPLPPNVSREEGTFLLTNAGPMVFLPTTDIEQPSRLLYRLGGSVPSAGPPPERTPDVEYVQRIIDAYGPGSHRTDGIAPPRVKAVFESSRHRVYSALADRFFVRAHGARVLLVGDAGHRHTPAGGQGMNLGICDGISAGAAIVQHIKTIDSSDAVLEEYAARRKKVAAEVIKAAEEIDVIEFPRNFLFALARDYILWAMMAIPVVNKAFARKISGIVYRD